MLSRRYILATATGSFIYRTIFLVPGLEQNAYLLYRSDIGTVEISGRSVIWLSRSVSSILGVLSSGE